MTVSADQDDDSLNDSATLVHEASGGDYGSVSTKVGVLVNDADSSNDSATLTHATSDADYASVTVDEPVTVTVDDAPERVFTPASVRVIEGAMGPTRFRWRRGRWGR